MSTQIGFVILSHDYPNRLRRLVRCIQRIYDNPPIAIHHDFGQCPLYPDEFPPDVRFVRPHTRTGWGKFSLVVAALRALRLLYQNAAPDWFVFLSGADYPTIPAGKVVKELKSSGMDALLDYREVPSLSHGSLKITGGLRISKYFVDIGALHVDHVYPKPENPALKHFVLPNNLELAWRRYLGFHVWLPVVRSGPRIGRYMFNLPFEDWRSPFDIDFKCLYGDQWFSGNSKVADILLNPTDKHIQLQRHLRFRYVADECYYQTVLGNSSDLKITNATRRFADWSQSAGGPLGGTSPKILSLDDVSAIVSSKSHFARKFSPASPVLDALDKMLM